MFQDTIASESNRRFADLVLGVPHPAVNTRDVGLYQPFRNALRSPNQLVRLPTLTFHLMGRRCQEGQQNPVRYTTNGKRAGTYVCILDIVRQSVGKCTRGIGPLPLTCQRMGECNSRRPLAVGPSAQHVFALLPVNFEEIATYFFF